MKHDIAVLITTRGNPERLLATCIAMAATANDATRIVFHLYIDADDTATLSIIERIAKHVEVVYVVGPRPQALGSAVNILAANAYAAGVSYLCVLNDDVFPMTVGWDTAVRGLSSGDVSMWAPAEGDIHFDYPILTRRFYEANGGRVFTDYFPFWFDDRWLMDAAVIGVPTHIKQLPIRLLSRKRRTQRMRDVAFWFSYYIFLEPRRVAHAQCLANALRDEQLDLAYSGAAMVRAFQLRAVHEADALKAEVTLANVVDLREPDPTYLEAKRKAEADMLAAGYEWRAAS